MQLTIINLINLNDTLTNNLLQNPIAEEEEEEHGPENSLSEFISIQFSFNFNVFEKLVSHNCKKEFIHYRYNLIDTFNPPPEIII
jgi:hypothetical protein